MRMTWAAASDPGVRRPVNEDSYCVRPDLGLFVVADGMGGHAAGEVASRLAVEGIEAYVSEMRARRTAPAAPASKFDTDAGYESAAMVLAGAFRMANRRLADAVSREAKLRGMATTASALLLDDTTPPVVAHVGDSRVYLLRGRELTRVTEDHSWVEEQVRAGVLDPRAARQHPWRSVVTRAINGGDDPRVDVIPLALGPGDRVLLCSDGLPVVVNDDRIAVIAAENRGLAEICRRLIAVANQEGGPDNITILAVEIHA
jgi:serine/threonine protein phosphatase PrpC